MLASSTHLPAVRAMLAGDDGSAERYAREQAGAFMRYLALQQEVYAAVTRWPDAPFWQRRRPPAG